MTLDDAISATLEPDWLNPLFATLHSREKETTAKTWWHAEPMHPAVFHALRMDKREEGAIFAAAPFRIDRSQDKARILVALPTPRILAPHDDDDWLGIEQVIAWNPKTDTAELCDEPGPHLAGSIRRDLDHLDVYGSPFAFFRALAEDRARWFVSWQQVGGDWRRKPREPDFSPGLLLIGAPDKVRWPRHAMPDAITAHGTDAKALNTAMLRQARVPRAVAAPLPGGAQ